MSDPLANIAMMRVAAIMLAAGESRRLGRAKQVLELGGETLLARGARIASEAGLAPIVVVVRADLAALPCLRGCDVVVNEQASEGMASSIRCGVERAGELGVDGAVVMACDQVGLRSMHLRELCGDGGRVRGSRYAGKVGIPAYFPSASFEELLKLRGDVGARELLRDAAWVQDEALRLDIDTEEDVEQAMKLFKE